MDDKVVLALVAGGVSLVVSLIGVAASFFNSRQSARASQRIEELKNQFARSSENRKLTEAQWLAGVDAIKEAMRAIQVVRDEIQLILVGYPESLDPEEARERLERARSLLLETFQSQHPNLGEKESTALHKAKNRAISIVQQLAGDDYRLQLSTVRDELREHQDTLRDGLTKRLIDRTLQE
ncbi:MAG TPA: hypothetical protein VLX28_27415 [Thermoanaerobaculia bacterium]|nr:hypothetical protein [Thermoanaerobaculia bacterium]